MTWHQIPDADAVFTEVRLPPAALEGVSHVTDGTYTVVKNDYASWTTLRERGLVLPAPLGAYRFKGRHSPRQHQRDGLEFLISNRRALLNHGLGCVDAETEFLSPTGWKRIDQWSGEKVMQYDRVTRVGSFVTPDAYIDKPCDRFIHIKTRNLDQMLSEEHRVLIRSPRHVPNKREEVLTAAELLHRQNMRLNAQKGQRLGGPASKLAFTQACIPVAFTAQGGTGVELTDAQLRLQIALMADGHFPYPHLNSCLIRLKKERKKERLVKLLADAGVEYVRRDITEADERCDTGFSLFRFQAPRHEKSYGDWWWDLSAVQLEVFRDEVLHWDGTFSTGNRFASFSSTDKPSIDFVQYAFSGAGYNTSIHADVREGRNTCYQLVISEHDQVGIKGTSVSGMCRTAMTLVNTPGARKYCFSVPTGFLILRRNGRVFVTGNSGKTLTASWAMDYLFEQKVIRRILIIGPVSVIGHVWTRELFLTFPHLRVLHIAGDARRKSLLAKDDADVFLINYESLHIVQDLKYDLIVCDESVKVKTPGTKAWKMVNHLAENSRLWLLTGLPTPQGPMDALGNIKLLRGPQAMTKTRWQMLTMRQITQFKWVPLPDAATTVAKWLTPAHCVKSEDCYDVPDVETIELEYDLTKEQLDFSKEIAKEARAELNGKTITATNAAHVLTKLLQVQAGGVYGEEKAPHTIAAEGFFDALTDLVESADTPVLIFANYRINAEAIAKHLQSTGLDTVLVTGDSKPQERREAFNAVERCTVRALVAVPTTMSHGIDNLVSARYVVWAQPCFSFDTYGQAVGRLVRQGQKNAVKVYHMVGSKVVRGLFNRLAEKDGLQRAVLDLIGTAV